MMIPPSNPDRASTMLGRVQRITFATLYGILCFLAFVSVISIPDAYFNDNFRVGLISGWKYSARVNYTLTQVADSFFQIGTLYYAWHWRRHWLSIAAMLLVWGMFVIIDNQP
jgi:hypothetical protein